MPSRKADSWIGLLSFGFFILIFALFFLVVPEYSTKVSEFLQDFQLEEVSSNISFPAPANHHPVVYEAVMQFSAIFGVFQFFVLALRLYYGSSTSKIAETCSNITLWLGDAYMFSYLLLRGTANAWFPFIGGIIAVFGFSLIVRSLIVLLWRVLWRPQFKR